MEITTDLIKLEDFPVSPWGDILGKSITTLFATCIIVARRREQGAHSRGWNGQGGAAGMGCKMSRAAHDQENATKGTFMPNFDAAIELVQPGNTALILKTDGTHLTFTLGEPGSSGLWRLKANRKVDMVSLRVSWGRSMRGASRSHYERRRLSAA
jgi:hypothetical protein